MRAIIIDDEIDARFTVSNFLKRYCPEVIIEGYGSSVKEGVGIVESKRPDILFLDIKMADGTGFDLLYEIQHEVYVIFVTAYDNYMLNAIRVQALDYLLKPIDPFELQKAVARAKEVIQKKGGGEVSPVKSDLSTRRGKRITVSDTDSVRIVYSGQVIKISSESNYSTIYLLGGSKLLSTRPLTEYEEMLESEEFFRVHNSHLVNIAFIDFINRKENNVKMIDGSEIEISRRRKSAFLDQISN